MSKLDNINYNKVNIKTDSMVKMIEQLAKLGVFKEKKKPRQKRVSINQEEVKQPSDMVGYTKTIGNFAPLTPILPGMSQLQIEDIQQRNRAMIENLRGEVSQQRLRDIEDYQGQRMADISTVEGIINPVLKRFRGAQEPGAGQRPDPFETEKPLIGDADIEEGLFTETLNEGAPKAVSQEPEGIYAGEEEPIVAPPPRLAPREPIENFRLTDDIMTEIVVYWGFGEIPKTRSVGPLRTYLSNINRVIGTDYATNVNREDLLKNIRAALRDSYRKIPETEVE
jgi:hypothetical protein